MEPKKDATMNATLTEYLSAIDNHDDSIDGAAKRTHIQHGISWHVDDGEELEEDPDEYRVECSCGAEFSTWVNARHHHEAEH
jgi:hypothetical protein